MAITNLQLQAAQIITENIRSNGQGLITGDLLQAALLLLDRDFFAGEIDCGFSVEMSDIESSIATLRPTNSLLNLLVEWYAGDYDNTYAAVITGGSIGAYLHLRRTHYLANDAITCTFLWNTVNRLYSFVVIPESSDFEDSYIAVETVEKLGSPKAITLTLPAESTTYSSRVELLTELGINADQLAEMQQGGFVYVYDIHAGRYLPFMSINNEEITFGYSASGGEEVYIINLLTNSVTVNVI